MPENENNITPADLKKAWAVYILATILLVIVLVLFVAEDNEEKLFFSLMTVAAAYVMRPTEKYMKKKIARFKSSNEK